MEPRFSARVTKGVLEVKTQASEAKGPFPGGKRVGSWGKKKKKVEGQYQRIDIRRSIKNGGVEGIGIKVGSWGKKRKRWRASTSGLTSATQ